MNDDDVENAIDTCTEAIAGYGDNTDFTQAQSVDIYRSIASFCTDRAKTIEGEMNDA